MDSTPFDLSDFLPFFKMFPGIYQFINERSIEEIKSFPFWYDMEGVIKNSFKDSIGDLHEFLLLAEEELSKYIEKKDDEFFKKIKEIEKIDIPLEILIDNKETVSITISFRHFSEPDLIPKIRDGAKLYIDDESVKKRIGLIDLVCLIILVIKNNKDGSSFKYVIYPGESKYYPILEFSQSGKYKNIGEFRIAIWENIWVFDVEIFQDYGDHWKKVGFQRGLITVIIRKGNLYLEIFYCFDSETGSIYTTSELFGVKIVKDPNKDINSSPYILYFEEHPKGMVVLGKNKAKFFIRISSEEFRSNQRKYHYGMGIPDGGIYVTDRPVSFRLFYCHPEHLLSFDQVFWYLIIEEEFSWEKVNSIPPDAFEIKAPKFESDGRFGFSIDEEVIPKLPLYPEILSSTNNYTESKKANKMTIRGHERRKLY